MRNEKGQFLKGESGNAVGLPKQPVTTDGNGLPLAGPDLYRANHDEVFAQLYRVITSKKTSDGPRVAAIREFMDRGFGKSQNSVLLRRDDGQTEIDVSGLGDEEIRAFLEAAKAAQARVIEDHSGDA